MRHARQLPISCVGSNVPPAVTFAACIVAFALFIASPLTSAADMSGALKALASGNFAAATDQLRPLAESGNVAAQLALGQILRNPANPQRQPEESLRWFTRAAEQNNAEANYWLGVMHRLGEGVARDHEQAIRLWRMAAEAGSASAQGALSQALFNGDGVAKEINEALRWAHQGAGRGNALAQATLAQAYIKGEGVPRSLSQFLTWTRRAAAQGHRQSMEALAVSYHTGTGVPQDYVQAHMWANLAAARGSARAVKLRDELGAKMTADQVAEAQKAASRWRPTAAQQAASGPADASGRRRTSTGSGFVVASPGYVLTNSHVVEQCTEVRVPAHRAVMRVLAQDSTKDLALLQGELPGSHAARFRSSSRPKLGEAVVVAGYPLSDLLASSINVTSGTVSALAGPKNDSSLFQITAPVQRGNSGGPVLDSQGDVIGVVVSKLNALRVAMATGDVPQNVNFAINGGLARDFIESNGVDLPDEKPGAPSSADTPEKARQFTVLIECWR